MAGAILHVTCETTLFSLCEKGLGENKDDAVVINSVSLSETLSR